jgi:hypothetical protein
MTILAQRPKLAGYIDSMRENIARALCTDVSNVSVKATTEEGMGFTGSGEGMAAQAVVLLKMMKTGRSHKTGAGNVNLNNVEFIRSVAERSLRKRQRLHQRQAPADSFRGKINCRKIVRNQQAAEQ